MEIKLMFRFILNETKDLRKYQIMLVGIFLLGALLNILFALNLKLFINSVVNNGIDVFQTIYTLTLGIGSVLITFTGIYSMEILKRKSQVNLWKKLCSRIFHSDMNEFKKESPGVYISKILSDTTLVGNLLGGLIPAVIVNSIRFASWIIALGIINIYLMYLTLIFLPIFILIYLKQAKGLLFSSLMERKAYGELTESLRNKIEATQMIKSFSVENVMNNLFEKESMTWYKKMKRVIFLLNIYGHIYLLLSIIIPLIVLLFINMMSVVDAGTVLVYFYFSSMILEPLTILVTDLGSMSQALPAVERVKKVMNLKQENFGKVELDKISNIVLDDVHYSYDGVEVLKGINLKISRDSCVAIVGPTGSGKSTLARILNGLYNPTKGMVKINDIPIKNYNKSLRKKVILCTGEDPVLPGTVKDNITLFENRFSERDVKEVINLLELEFDINTKIGPGVRDISLGQQQRIVLARALIRKPECLILDEALSGINPELEKRIVSKIKAIVPILIIITHREATVAHASQVYFLKDGKLFSELS